MAAKKTVKAPSATSRLDALTAVVEELVNHASGVSRQSLLERLHSGPPEEAEPEAAPEEGEV